MNKQEHQWYLVTLVSMGMALVSLTSSSSITSVLAAEALLLDSMITVDAALPSLSSRSATTASASAASTSMGRVLARSRATSCSLSTPTSTTCSTGSVTFPRADFLVELWVAASGELVLLFFELVDGEVAVVGDETLGELKLFLFELLVVLPGEAGFAEL